MPKLCNCSKERQRDYDGFICQPLENWVRKVKTYGGDCVAGKIRVKKVIIGIAIQLF